MNNLGYLKGHVESKVLESEAKWASLLLDVRPFAGGSSAAEEKLCHLWHNQGPPLDPF